VIRVSELSKTFGHGDAAVTAVDGVSFDVAEGSLVTLLGPSGCGKTTTLRLLAGLERGTDGLIEIGGEVAFSGAKGRFMPVHRRPIGMVFQSYAVWPHMTVEQNVAFPLRIQRPRLTREVWRERVHEALGLVGLADYAGRPSTALSGGQQQRVALARALVRRPKVLLLDEPLSNLDAELRERMREDIRELQQRLGITTIFVTHDQAEALAVSDQVVIMNGGRIVEQGPPQAMYAAPRTEFAAVFLGISNRFEGSVVSISEGLALVETSHGHLTATGAVDGAAVGERVTVFMRPESFALSRKDPGNGAWRGTVRFSIYHGDSWDYHVDVGEQVIRVRVYREKVGLVAGDKVHLAPIEGAGILGVGGTRG
jgi:iron(III) transport system ATP-binding protein